MSPPDKTHYYIQNASVFAQSRQKNRPASEPNLPAWYYRLVRLTIKKDREVEPEDFDEDLSELEEPSEAAEDNTTEHGECECDSDSNCDCECFDDTGENQSQKSYDGSDAHFYYELKSEREERKRELRDMRERERKKKEERESEIQKEKEVQEAYKHLQEAVQHGDTLPKLDPRLGYFKLYSVQHFDYCYDPYYYPTKYVEFYNMEEAIRPGGIEYPPNDNITELNGHIYFNVNCGCDFATFAPPQEAGLEGFVLGDYRGETSVKICFISKDYLTLTVPREMVFMPDPLDSSAPETFKFMGIRHDYHEQRQRLLANLKRPPSPHTYIDTENTSKRNTSKKNTSKKNTSRRKTSKK